jgi:hypothetical protein
VAIARELAERNGSTLELTPTDAGTSFTLVISALATMALKEGPVTRSLGEAGGAAFTAPMRAPRAGGFTGVSNRHDYTHIITLPYYAAIASPSD